MKVFGSAIAACVLLPVAWWAFWHPNSWQSYSASALSTESLSLPDGTVVYLNTSSEVAFRYTRKEREVRLTAGQALFIVRHDSERPFDVELDSGIVRAVGTAFDVRVLPEKRFDLVVRQGSVMVLPGNSEQSSERASTPQPVRAGQEAFGVATSLQISDLTGQDLADKATWIGKFHFKETPLEQAVAQFNAVNRIQLVLTPPELGSLKVGGAFSASEPKSFAEALQTLHMVRIASPSGQPDEVIRLEGYRRE